MNRKKISTSTEATIKLAFSILYKFKSFTYFFAGTVFCKFQSFNVWSSEAVIKTGSTGWNARALTPSKWL